jgi:hypothetical protein
MSSKVLMAGVVAIMVLAAGVGQAQADVFDMPSGQTSLLFVPVGDPGNAADTTGYGSVGYPYQMGKYDVTVGQYCGFLNAVAKTDRVLAGPVLASEVYPYAPGKNRFAHGRSRLPSGNLARGCGQHAAFCSAGGTYALFRSASGTY